MKLFFASRTKAREFSKNTGKKVTDMGQGAVAGQRWAHIIVKGN